MELLNQIQLNVVAFAFLLYVFILSRRRLDRQSHLNRLFLVMSCVVLVELFVEVASIFVDGVPGIIYLILANVINTLIFILAPIVTLYYVFFIYNIIHPYHPIKSKTRLIMMIPIMINFIFAVLSPKYGFYFYIDAANVYVRGDLFLLTASITYTYAFLGLFIVIFNYKKLIFNDFSMLFVIGALPLIGSGIQAAFYGVLTMWGTVAFSLILSYMFLQERMIHIDVMTGAWTRESFYVYYSKRLQLFPNEVFGAIYFDIDNLKSINDQFGHLEGDHAIEQLIGIVRTSIHPKDIIARLGGDEFVIACTCETVEYLYAVVSTIKKNIRAYNQSYSEYHLDASFGYDLYSPKFNDLDAFLRHIDFLMYDDKKQIEEVKNDA